ncbi:MAG TPA: hypothetical protein VFG60_04630 [Burkholderiaceae bacterium]|nr:hypothetical protein [Burkholderiaceae bacterium]
MIWAKTDAGRGEMHARALVKERAQRNLLLVIDGVKSEEMLLTALAGISSADFLALQALGLIAPARASGARAAAVATAAPAPTLAAAPAASPSAPLDFAPFADALTQLISNELGLRGFVLALAVQKADSVETLHGVAQRAFEQIRERKGETAAAAAQRKLYGA